MSVTFEVPNQLILLPNPQIGESKIPLSKFTNSRAQDNTQYTYVKKSDDYKHVLDFILTKSKALEFESFIDNFLSSRLIYTDMAGDRWRGYIITNPVTLEFRNRCGRCSLVPVSVEFQGKKV